MIKVIIDGKEYYQQEESDIEKLPFMSYSKDLLKNNQPKRLSPEDASNSVCDSLNSTNK